MKAPSQTSQKKVDRKSTKRKRATPASPKEVNIQELIRAFDPDSSEVGKFQGVENIWFEILENPHSLSITLSCENKSLPKADRKYTAIIRAGEKKEGKPYTLYFQTDALERDLLIILILRLLRKCIWKYENIIQSSKPQLLTIDILSKIKQKFRGSSFVKPVNKVKLKHLLS